MKIADLYAPPNAPLASGPLDDEPELPPWRLVGDTLLVRKGATLPDVCLFSGAPTTPGQRIQLQLSWTPSWFRAAAVVFPFLAVIGYSVVRRTANVEIALAHAGRRRRALIALLTLGAVGAALALLYVVAETNDREALTAALALTLVGLIVAAASSRIFRVVKIDRRCAHLRLRPAVAAAFARLPPPTTSSANVAPEGRTV
jgi:hypothetical protein